MTDKIHSAATDTFRSLRHRNFRLFFGGQLVSQTGTWLSMVTQTLLVLKLTDSGVALGLLMAFQFGPMLLLGAWAGAVADRADKRKMLTVLQAAAMGQSFALGLLVLSGGASVATIYALAAIQGVITAFDNPVRRSFVVEMVPADDLPNAVSLNSAVMTGSRVFGPAIAGALVLTVGYGWPFIIDGFSYLAVIGSLLMMRSDELFRSAPTPHRKGQVREGLRYIRSEPNLLVPLIMMALIGTFAFNFQVTVPLLVDGPLSGGTGTFTLLFSVLSLGSLIGALATARRSSVRPQQLVNAAAAFGGAMVLLALAPNLGVAFPVSVLLGLASIAFMTTSTAIVQLLAGPEYRGRVLAIQGMVFLGSTPIGGPIVGWVSDAVGPRAGIAVGAVACFAAAAYGARALDLGDRRLTGEPAPTPVVDVRDEVTGEVALVD
ncbi:MAG: arabinose efflux permease family protein [Ilumatobacteraceae bacterium]|nr:arabinose efflux permease family protein [Ilumatobacteraceae bacterium]